MSICEGSVADGVSHLLDSNREFVFGIRGHRGQDHWSKVKENAIQDGGHRILPSYVLCPCPKLPIIILLTAAVAEWVVCASHQGEPGSIPGRVTPGFSNVRIVPEDAAGRRVSLEISLIPRPFILTGIEPMTFPVGVQTRSNRWQPQVRQCHVLATLIEESERCLLEQYVSGLPDGARVVAVVGRFRDALCLVHGLQGRRQDVAATVAMRYSWSHEHCSCLLLLDADRQAGGTLRSQAGKCSVQRHSHAVLYVRRLVRGVDEFESQSALGHVVCVQGLLCHDPNVAPARHVEQACVAEYHLRVLPEVHAARQEHCTPVQSLVFNGDRALVRVAVSPSSLRTCLASNFPLLPPIVAPTCQSLWELLRFPSSRDHMRWAAVPCWVPRSKCLCHFFSLPASDQAMGWTLKWVRWLARDANQRARNTAPSSSLFVSNRHCNIRTIVQCQSVDPHYLRLHPRALTANPTDHIIDLIQNPVGIFPTFL
ncbi:hypothetical protein PR048_015421 [Dryococelus australis]|uniref:Uncharacterized protein n=1 Tax=Dryococelus australis TaxID=614101 RepID=A0ABQ9HGX7_9NEOP|nr:hypothetical protein PR048_015421 [Dryococelus australis]